MARKSNTRATHGAGSIRQRPDGTWEARFVTGHDPGSGKAVRKSVYAKTQKEVRQKLAQAVAAVDNKADHNLFRLESITDQYVTHQTLPGHLIIGRNIIRFHMRQYQIQNLFVDLHA